MATKLLPLWQKNQNALDAIKELDSSFFVGLDKHFEEIYKSLYECDRLLGEAVRIEAKRSQETTAYDKANETLLKEAERTSTALYSLHRKKKSNETLMFAYYAVEALVKKLEKNQGNVHGLAKIRTYWEDKVIKPYAKNKKAPKPLVDELSKRSKIGPLFVAALDTYKKLEKVREGKGAVVVVLNRQQAVFKAVSDDLAKKLAQWSKKETSHKLPAGKLVKAIRAIRLKMEEISI